MSHYDERDFAGSSVAKYIARQGERRADAQQAVPTGTGDVVLDAVLPQIDRMLHYTNPTVDGERWLQLKAVRKALVERSAFGEKKYGTKLRVLNGRDATYDLYQELLDGIMYAMQARMEDKPGGHMVELLVGLAGQIVGRFDI